MRECPLRAASRRFADPMGYGRTTPLSRLRRTKDGKTIPHLSRISIICCVGNSSTQPNEGHKLIADLEKDYNVTVVTQNVDNLHERAGSSKVVHLHGELTKVCSERDPYNPHFIQELTADNPEVNPGTQAGDGSLLRPFIVFFGESVPMIEPAATEVSTADIFVIIGTSLNVYPAAGLVRYVRSGTPIYIIDPEPVTADTNSRIVHIAKGASAGMQALTKSLRSLN